MHRLILLLSSLILAIPALANDLVFHQQTAAPANSRYEIIQSSLAAKFTFRLDKYTGRVWQLVKTTNDENTWEEMLVLDLEKAPEATRAHFQIFLSGLAAKHSFLIDTDTGKTWLPVVGTRMRADGSEYEITSWQPFAP